MLLLHTLSRLAFSDQPWRPLLAGFLLHFAACEGFKPRLNHCVLCGKRMEEPVPAFFDPAEGGLCCAECAGKPEFQRSTTERTRVPLTAAQILWMKSALVSGSAAWTDAPDRRAPFPLLRGYVESRLGRKIRSGTLLPEESFPGGNGQNPHISESAAQGAAPERRK